MTDYSKLKVAELKELVKERGIGAPGLKLKQQFIDALAAADAGAEGGQNQEETAEETNDDAPGESEVVEKVEEAGQTAPEPEKVGEDGGNGMIVDEPVKEAEDTKPDEVMKDEAIKDSVIKSSDSDAATLDHEDADSNKRKRRSPTPPLREESVAKKLKTAPADEVPVLAEDSVDMADEPLKSEPIEREGKDEDMKDAPDHSADGDAFIADTTSTAPAQHSATRALYIRNLVRPLQPHFLRDHLVAIASPPSSDPDTSIVEGYHLDKLRSHSLVLFSSISAASRARSALHDQVWPPEPMRKPLFADFIPEDKFQEWVDLEISRERDNLRWEVVYTTNSEDGKVTASLQEASATRQQSTSQNHPPTGPRASLAGEGMPNAPSGPRRLPTPPEPRESKSFTTLDASYKFTESKPKIYWQPVDPELAARRLEELDRETSQSFDGNMGSGEMRRYTFEDGDKIVDGGVDWGKFGGGGHHNSGPPPRRGGGRDFGGRRGRGGGGGGYGGAGGYRGDSYRGGGARW